MTTLNIKLNFSDRVILEEDMTPLVVNEEEEAEDGDDEAADDEDHHDQAAVHVVPLANSQLHFSQCC